MQWRGEILRQNGGCKFRNAQVQVGGLVNDLRQRQDKGKRHEVACEPDQEGGQRSLAVVVVAAFFTSGKHFGKRRIFGNPARHVDERDNDRREKAQRRQWCHGIGGKVRGGVHKQHPPKRQRLSKLQWMLHNVHSALAQHHPQVFVAIGRASNSFVKTGNERCHHARRGTRGDTVPETLSNIQGG